MGTEELITRKSSFAHRTYRWEGLVFNAACGLYFLLLSPIITGTADRVLREPETTSLWLGVLLVAVTLTELWAFPVKMRFVNEAVRVHGDPSGKAYALWLCHAVISVVLVMMAAECFGAPPTGQQRDAPAWMAVVMPIVVLKELAFLVILGATRDADAAPDQRYARPSRREWMADALLVAYACIAYSATWSTITRGMDLAPDTPAMFALNLFVASLMFLIFYLPLRIPYWIEELAQAKSWRDWLRIAGSVLLVLVPALAMV